MRPDLAVADGLRPLEMNHRQIFRVIGSQKGYSCCVLLGRQVGWHRRVVAAVLERSPAGWILRQQLEVS